MTNKRYVDGKGNTQRDGGDGGVIGYEKGIESSH